MAETVKCGNQALVRLHENWRSRALLVGDVPRTATLESTSTVSCKISRQQFKSEYLLPERCRRVHESSVCTHTTAALLTKHNGYNKALTHWETRKPRCVHTRGTVWYSVTPVGRNITLFCVTDTRNQRQHDSRHVKFPKRQNRSARPRVCVCV